MNTTVTNHKDSPWSSILSSLEKGYTKANYDLNKQAQQNNALAVQSGQKAVTDLYTVIPPKP